MPHDGHVAVAILDHGRGEAFVVHTPRRCGSSDAGHAAGLRGDRLLLKTQAACPPITWMNCEPRLSLNPPHDASLAAITGFDGV